MKNALPLLQWLRTVEKNVDIIVCMHGQISNILISIIRKSVIVYSQSLHVNNLSIGKGINLN